VACPEGKNDKIRPVPSHFWSKTSAGLAFGTGTWASSAGGIIPAAFGAAEAVPHDTPPETLAWRLLRQSLTRALAELVGETLANPPGSR
jgi:hypothetical protein